MLNRDTLKHGVSVLCATDRDFASVVRRIGAPPLWARKPGFATLVRIILEQQVSLASAKATYQRLQQALGRVTASRVANTSLAELRRYGITRQKSEYCLDLAQFIVAGKLDLPALARADDTTARLALRAVRGIGCWTADIYLLMALRRPDVWPNGDLALAESARHVKRLSARPTDEQLFRIATRWKPWRSVAARILWHHYLSERRGRAVVSEGRGARR